MNAPKRVDLGGAAAWIDGAASIDAVAPADILYCFVQRRLQAIANITHRIDPSKVIDMNFEAMLMAIEQMPPQSGSAL